MTVDYTFGLFAVWLLLLLDKCQISG